MDKSELRQRVSNDFAYHQPNNEHVGHMHDFIRTTLKNTALDIINHTPICREQSLALTALEEAMHWANAAIAKNQYEGG